MPAPRLSVVLVVYREQAYLRECVLSVLEQSFHDVELLVIDNASPDHGPQILDELAQADSRLSVRRLDHTVSLGEARNVALESATGEYVWFVETTDLLPEGAAGAVAARLDETAPDVLVFDHTRAGSLGRAKPGPYRGLIRAASRSASFTLEEWPEAADLAVDVWDKVFRRGFLRSLGVRFAARRYGGLSVTYAALLTANRIAALDRVCYARRRPGNACDERRVHGSPFDVFEEYDAVFSFADSQAGPVATRRRFLVARMLRHYLSILRDIPADRRSEFFSRMGESFCRHARGDQPISGGRVLRMKARLVAQRRYAPFSGLEWAGEQRRAARKRSGNAKRWLVTIVRARRKRRMIAEALRRNALASYYRSQLRQPIDSNLAVFAAYWYRGYACNPRAIYEKMRELAPWIRGVWIVNDEYAATMPQGVEYVVAGTRDYYELLARAKYFVNNVNFPNEFVKREGAIHVQTHHGTPVKKMGLDLRDAFVAGSRMNFELLLRRCARWDYSVTSNAFSTLVWERAYPVRYETLEVGYPRNDVLVNSTDSDIERIRDELGIAPGRQAVLYAPTHREYLPGYVPTLDIGRVADTLGPGYVIMARVHYFYGSDESLGELHRAGRILDVARHPSIEELCLAADVLVTDYSATMFDYGVLDRPIVIHAPDWDDYRKLRGTYFDLLAEPPGVVTTSDDELVRAFQSGAVWSDDAARLRAAFRARFCALDDGRAAERVVRRVWLSEQDEKPAARPAPRIAIEA